MPKEFSLHDQLGLGEDEEFIINALTSLNAHQRKMGGKDATERMAQYTREYTGLRLVSPTYDGTGRRMPLSHVAIVGIRRKRPQRTGQSS